VTTEESEPRQLGITMKRYHVYIITNNSRTLYTGVTSNIRRRMMQHETKVYPGSFSARYNINKLVYFEEFSEAELAMIREKQIKGLLRKKKIALIESMNPEWNDLSLGL
jgi:putative endonuclease